jgi:hypothetical protein
VEYTGSGHLEAGWARCRTDWRTTVLHPRPVDARHRLADHQQMIGHAWTQCTQLYNKQGEKGEVELACRTDSVSQDTVAGARTY